MKIKLGIGGIIMCAGLAVFGGCGQKEQPAADVQPPKPSEATASQAAKTVEAVATTATQVVEQATAQTKAAEQQTQGLIDRAKASISEQKYQDALGSLTQLSNFKLTADQQKVVDGLKAQIQSALAKATATITNPASALGGVLGSKK